jgi:chitinase
MKVISRICKTFLPVTVRHQLALLVVFIMTTFFCTATIAISQTKVVGYVTNDQYHNVDYAKLTHLNIAFENPDAIGDISFSSVNDSYIRGAHNHGVKVLVSLAGGGASHDPAMQNLYFNLIKDSNRSAFVQKIKAYVLAHNLDGVDVDLEGPAINDNYRKFIAELSTALKGQGKLLTSALSHLNGASKVSDSTMHLFDFINIMAYDQTGPWRPDKQGQHSSFGFALESLDYWIQRGLPKDKAVLGVPFYGYGFGPDFNQGMGFAQIIERFPNSQNEDVVGNTIYYNGIPTISRKTQHVIDNGFGGIMIWQLGHDASGEFSLLSTIHKVIEKKRSR